MRRKKTKSKRQLPADFLINKFEVLDRVENIIKKFAIPPKMVFTWDQTGLPLRPTSKWTIAPEGSQQIAVDGGEDKRMITMQLVGTASGGLLCPQLIHGGKTVRCEPQNGIPQG